MASFGDEARLRQMDEMYAMKQIAGQAALGNPLLGNPFGIQLASSGIQKPVEPETQPNLLLLLED